ncbi:MAG: hypothetical protein WCJ14_13275 [Verrucomicrobiota bacterium]
MPQISPLPAAQDPTPPSPATRHVPGDLETLFAAYLEQTAEALLFSQAATQDDVTQALDAVHQAHADGKPVEMLEAVARVQGYHEEHFGRVIRGLGDKLAAVLNPSPPLIPFAGKLIAPSAFYDSFEHLHRLAKVLLSPVIYAEDTDAIGTASVNPIAAALFAEEIRNAVFKRFGIRPFVTAARLDYESWTFLSRKHFEL